ncbi:hypothetical protein T4A_5306 [Trichinella pseudospiralis]|uniref:Uncharacterized protein n=1 Tax=Trichinella pseudospiralis TaxID=6337 RepID=A0A0V1E2J7_TRIPS|nr:hypothetical protein T4A_5306 [Trichinella pseudospiralis]
MQIFDRGRDIKNVLSVLNSSHSRTCLPENVCKFLFHCYVYAYVALVSMACGIMDEHGNIVNGFAFCSLLFYFFKLVHLHLEKREYKFDMKAVMASVLANDVQIVLKERDGLQRSEDACLFREVIRRKMKTRTIRSRVENKPYVQFPMGPYSVGLVCGYFKRTEELLSLTNSSNSPNILTKLTDVSSSFSSIFYSCAFKCRRINEIIILRLSSHKERHCTHTAHRKPATIETKAK